MSKPVIPNGTIIDNRYLIQKVLGQGGLGRTYLTLDTRRFNEACVLKEFAPSGTGKHSLQKSRALFKREAEILYHIQHAQIPDFLACFEGDERLFLVQEYVNGQTYSDLLKARRKQNTVFSEQEVIDWLNNLLPVLDYIHQRGIIHRDISPDNIMLPSKSNLPVLIDFGVGKQIIDAAQLGGKDEEISYVGKMSLVGKVGYAPHEQIRLGACSPSSDLYALGVTAVVLLTCKDPLTLMNQYSLQWEWRSHANISPAFGTIIDKMLADTPAVRYQKAPEVSMDLAQLANSGKTAINGLDPLKLSPTSVKSYSVETAISTDPQSQDLSIPSPSDAHLQPKDKDNGNTAIEDGFLDKRPVENSPVASTVSSSGFFKETFADNVTTDSSLPVSGLSEQFVLAAQRQLAEYLGPMAAMIVDETIQAEQPATPAQLVELLMLEIPSSKEAIAFREALMN